MNAPHPDLAAGLARCRQAADHLMGLPPGAEAWAAEAADALLGLTPGVRVALCRRGDRLPIATAVRAARGPTPPSLAEALEAEAFRLDARDAGAWPAPALGAALGARCLAARLRDRRGPWGIVAVGGPPDAPAEALTLTRTLLTDFAAALTHRRRLEDAERERDELAAFALAGQATAQLAHELNNCLNGISLQASVLQMELGASRHGPLDAIRRQTAQASTLLRPLGQASAERARDFYPVSLFCVLDDLLRADGVLSARVHVTRPAGRLPPLRGCTSALKQLLRLVLSAASAAAPLRLQAAAADASSVRLTAQGTGPASAGQENTSDAVVWARSGDLARAAGQSLLRQLGAELRVAARPDGGFVLTLTWPAWCGGPPQSPGAGASS